jgi:RNA polymerase sigma-70 factor, ECF subfamily
MDEDVLELLARGRYERAFEILLERYKDKVFHLALSFTREASSAEDLAQETFLKLWRVLPRYDGRASVSTWLYTIARNTCLSHLRDERPGRALPVFESGPERGDDGTAGIDARRLLAKLPDRDRQLLTLFYMEGRSYEEVAKITGMPLGTVKSYLHRARRMLAGMAGLPASRREKA